MSFSLGATDLAKLFSSTDLKQTLLEVLVDSLIEHTYKGNSPSVDDIKKGLKKLGILKVNPIDILRDFKIISIDEKSRVRLHPIVSEDLNLWSHFLEILRNRFGVPVSSRTQKIGNYLKYMDTLHAQMRFLVLNLSIEPTIVLNAVKGLFTMRMEEHEDLMSFQDALRFYKYRENLNEKATSALKTLSENMHLLTKNDMLYLKETMLTIDKVAAQTEIVKQEFTKFSVNAFLSGVIKFDDILEFENNDELTTLSLLMNMESSEKLKVETVDADDPISNLIRRVLHRDLPKGRRKAIIRLIASFFKDFFIREGFINDMQQLIDAFYQKEFDIKSTLFKTIKKMQIWTPMYKQKVKASSTNIILVNDLSGSMIASYIGQVELFQGLIESITQDIESEIVFVSFSSETFAINNANIDMSHEKEEFLGLLTENTMGMTDINCVIDTLLSGTPTRGDAFTPPDPDDTIIFFISDLQETIGGTIDPEKVEQLLHDTKKFFLSVPREYFNHDNYQLFLEEGAIPILYDNIIDIPRMVMNLIAKEINR